MRRLRCPRCHAEWSAPQASCGACYFETLLAVPMSRDGVPYGSRGAEPYRARRRPTVPFEEDKRTQQRPKLVTFGYPHLRQPLDGSTAVTGPPGGGKSTFATRAAMDLALQGIRVLWVSPEEGRNPTTTRRFDLVHGWLGHPPLPGGGPLISDSRTLHEVDEELRAFEATGGQVVFIDSLTTLGASAQWWEDLTNGPLGVVGIAHQNSRGGPHGGNRVAHDPDAHISVRDFTVTVQKTRWFDPDAPRTWRVDEPLDEGEREAPAGEVVAFPGARGTP